VDWFPGIEASSVDLIEAYVANGLGIGVSVAIPRKISSPRVRALPLDGFPPVVIGAMWRGRKTPLIEIFLAEAQKRAKQLG
jgi:DNA-binding transcriptional LysR family regulator